MTVRSGDLAHYDLHSRGHLDRHWAEWLDATSMRHDPDGTTTIRTAPIDDTRLHAVLAQLTTIGGTLLRLERLEPEQPAAALGSPIDTPRLRLRAATPHDAHATWTYRRRPEVARWLSELPTHEGTYCADFNDPVRLAATVIVERDGVLVGDFMLRLGDAWAQHEVRHAHANQAELGWTLDPAHTGHGYATEAVTALLQHCFTTLGVHRVTAESFLDNEPSLRLMERVGMRREAHLRRDALHRTGRWLDSVIYAVLTDEWAAPRSWATGVGRNDVIRTVRWGDQTV